MGGWAAHLEGKDNPVRTLFQLCMCKPCQVEQAADGHVKDVEEHFEVLALSVTDVVNTMRGGEDVQQNLDTVVDDHLLLELE